MTKYHINKHGVPAICRATKGNCPLGDDDSHFDSYEEAEESIKQTMTGKYGILSTIEASEIRDIDGLLHYVEEDELLDEVLSRLDDEEIELISDELNEMNGGYKQGIDNIIESYNNSDFESISEVIHDVTGDKFNEIISELNNEYNIKDERYNDRSIGWTLRGMKHESTMSTDADFKEAFTAGDINIDNGVPGSTGGKSFGTGYATGENKFVVARELGDHRIKQYENNFPSEKLIDTYLEVDGENQTRYLVNLNRNLVTNHLVKKMGLNKEDFPVNDEPRKDFDRIRKTLNDDDLIWSRLSKRLNNHEMIDEPSEDERLNKMDEILGINSRKGFRQK